MKQKDSRETACSFSKSVKLNVGGTVYKTSLTTLMKDPNSMLAAMFSGRHDVQPDDDGAYFIDRDGTTFRFILNYLRIGKLICPSDEATKLDIQTEAEFYQIQGILDELKPKCETRTDCFLGSSVIICDKTQDSRLTGWLPRDSKCCLLYRASRDGWTAREFHQRCDNKGATITILKSRDGYIGGGYTTHSWQSLEVEKSVTDPHAFLFSLTNPSSHESTLLRQAADRHGNPGGIVCSRHDGPHFGTRMYFDLKTLQTSADGSLENFVDIGHGFECPKGHDRRRFLFGSSSVELDDMEVFVVQSKLIEM